MGLLSAAVIAIMGAVYYQLTIPKGPSTDTILKRGLFTWLEPIFSDTPMVLQGPLKTTTAGHVVYHFNQQQQLNKMTYDRSSTQRRFIYHGNQSIHERYTDGKLSNKKICTLLEHSAEHLKWQCINTDKKHHIFELKYTRSTGEFVETNGPLTLKAQVDHKHQLVSFFASFYLIWNTSAEDKPVPYAELRLSRLDKLTYRETRLLDMKKQGSWLGRHSERITRYFIDDKKPKMSKRTASTFNTTFEEGMLSVTNIDRWNNPVQMTRIGNIQDAPTNITLTHSYYDDE